LFCLLKQIIGDNRPMPIVKWPIPIIGAPQTNTHHGRQLLNWIMTSNHSCLLHRSVNI